MNTLETTEKFVDKVIKGNNVDALKDLEKILQNKVAKKIKETLNDE